MLPRILLLLSALFALTSLARAGLSPHVDETARVQQVDPRDWLLQQERETMRWWDALTRNASAFDEEIVERMRHAAQEVLAASGGEASGTTAGLGGSGKAANAKGDVKKPRPNFIFGRL